MSQGHQQGAELSILASHAVGGICLYIPFSRSMSLESRDDLRGNQITSSVDHQLRCTNRAMPMLGDLGWSSFDVRISREKEITDKAEIMRNRSRHGGNKVFAIKMTTF